MDKKGLGLLDPITSIVFIFFVIALFAGIIYLFGMLNDTLGTIDATVGTNNVSDVVEDTFGQVNVTIQDLRLLSTVMIFGLFLFSLVSGFFSRLHPIFAVAYVGVVILGVILAVPVANAYETLIQDQVFDGEMQTFKFGNWVLLHLPYVIAVYGLLSAIFIFAGITRGGAGNVSALGGYSSI